jgi:hypothetical protein
MSPIITVLSIVIVDLVIYIPEFVFFLFLTFKNKKFFNLFLLNFASRLIIILVSGGFVYYQFTGIGLDSGMTFNSIYVLNTIRIIVILVINLLFNSIFYFLFAKRIFEKDKL